MRLIQWTCLFFFGASLLASAGTLDDFNRGLAADNRHDYDTAISSLSSALSAGDLLPGLLPIAFLDRGMAYIGKKQYAQAVADFGSTIKLRPDNVDAYEQRAFAFYELGERQSAADDCATLNKLKAYWVQGFAWCGPLFWDLGDYQRAGEFLETALLLHSGNRTYNVLWLQLVRLRTPNSDSDQSSRDAEGLNIDGWPQPLLKLFLGKMPVDKVLEKAARGNEEARQRQACEAGFYVGEWQLLHGEVTAAKSLFQQAVTYCRQDNLELVAAQIELTRLTTEQGR